jgi:ABC-type long-subunit fatty acid transport system fused permease/ATPase subunit
MSASEQQRAEWLEPSFWERLDQLEGRHQRIQSDHDRARRGLERLGAGEAEELRRAWLCYCAVIAELDETTAELEALRRT